MPLSSSHQRRPPSCVTCSLLAPCGRALTRLCRVPASAALSIRAFRFRSLRKAMSPRRRRRHRTFRSVRAVFWPLVQPSSSAAAATSAAEDDAARGSAETTTELLAAVQEAPQVYASVSLPETPAYVKAVARLRSGRSTSGGGDNDREKKKEDEACRSFETCLMEMLVEEGKARDLQDVEELLRCWERLKSPVFLDLVGRFYGELCNDMFPATGSSEDDDDSTGSDKNGCVASVSTSVLD